MPVAPDSQSAWSHCALASCKATFWAGVSQDLLPTTWFLLNQKRTQLRFDLLLSKTKELERDLRFNRVHVQRGVVLLNLPEESEEEGRICCIPRFE